MLVPNIESKNLISLCYTPVLANQQSLIIKTEHKVGVTFISVRQRCKQSIVIFQNPNNDCQHYCETVRLNRTPTGTLIDQLVHITYYKTICECQRVSCMLCSNWWQLDEVPAPLQAGPLTRPLICFMMIHRQRMRQQNGYINTQSETIWGSGRPQWLRGDSGRGENRQGILLKQEEKYVYVQEH